MSTSWKKQFEALLHHRYALKRANSLSKKYGSKFSASYSVDYPASMAVDDIDYLEKLSDENPIAINFYYSADPKAEYPLHLRLFQWQKPIPLSDILPIFENLDLRTDNERPDSIVFGTGQTIWISDFAVTYKRPIAIEEIRSLFQEAFIKIYFGAAENDGFNKLILGAALTWREIMILRAYAKYLRQVLFRFSQSYIEKALVDNASIARNLVLYFLTAHNPDKKSKREFEVEKIEQRILQSLENVRSLDEDRIIRRLLDVLKATLRCNYFQLTADKQPKDYFSFKLDSRKIPELPQPLPLYGIFVYSPRFEAIHLRYTKVARGGIRWSDRVEDFRTEILGLMKAQVVKNAVIVPSGAKGGFVLKQTFPHREEQQLAVIAAYKAFISGLLDITDNIVGEKNIHPKQVVCYDDFDPYLVVAADKGTASFSDLANEIAESYHFWLGDAFASGGRTGYDHKKMGITARGAWESIKRHFRELGINTYQEVISIVGIGDMSGDVFGNGMLYSKKIKLIAAFDHRNIFIDPQPDPDISYRERERLFNLPISSWEDYNPKLISKGGGVFKRTVKSITLTPQIKRVLDIQENSLAPTDLIRAILKAPVDLLYNGGIGTYVKASTETQAEVGDRTNDYCRINGNELRCRVVGEGGNLGFTQLGRVEYALAGGLIFTDFIDNSGGVDCSDHEVNLKILLNQEIQKKKLSEKKRDELLMSVTDEVADLVLFDNYAQALVMSFSAFHAKQNMGLHINYIKELETLGILNREIEFLPSEKDLSERKAADIGLTRPELAILLAYTKIHIKQALLNSNLPEDPYLRKNITSAFPFSIRKKYHAAMQDHRLARNIIATQLSNQVVNGMGITFVYRMQIETGASIPEIIRAHAVAANVFGTKDIRMLIEGLDFKIQMSEQYEMLYNIRHLINLSTRWFLQGNHMRGNLQSIIDHYATHISTLKDLTPSLMSGVTKDYLETLTTRFMAAGLLEGTAKKIATYRAIYTSLNIIDVATRYKFNLIKTAQVYFAAGERVNLLWFRDQIANDARVGHWNALARLTLRDELDVAQRALTIAIMHHDKKNLTPKTLITDWTRENSNALKKWDRLLNMLHSQSDVDYTMFFIAMRELIALILASHELKLKTPEMLSLNV
ncbi:MAG: NAD-glutamate dehydrogenase [Gammaproteobacteria bacterium]|nr:NAD-glutamate dehydrogenase [Gammaproteobacteria bacterium]